MEKTALEKIKEAIYFEEQGGSYYVITKLCNIASKIFENDGKFEIFLQTPFGVAKILITQKDDSLVLGSPCKYTDALKKIEKNDITKKLEYTEKILKYLSILDNENIKDNDPLYNKIIKLAYEHYYAKSQMDDWYDDPNHDPMVPVDEEFEKFRVMEENSEKKLIQIITNL